MIIKKSGGRWQLSLLASVVISAFFSQHSLRLATRIYR
ncbi:lipase [Escherichia coli]|uniref:Lipase n=1 Tax=Escherichia coli TaxID=562 RepID=A0A376Y0S9_ECOLX|nr:lipase [Escherichia coli]STJ77900.1 lipase [Escherichia coli]